VRCFKEISNRIGINSEKLFIFKPRIKGGYRSIFGIVLDSNEAKFGLKVAGAMRKNIVTIDETTSVAEASMDMRNKGEGCAIVLRQGRPFGIVTERDVTWKVAGKGLNPKTVSRRDHVNALDNNRSRCESRRSSEDHETTQD